MLGLLLIVDEKLEKLTAKSLLVTNNYMSIILLGIKDEFCEYKVGQNAQIRKN